MVWRSKTCSAWLATPAARPGSMTDGSPSLIQSIMEEGDLAEAETRLAGLLRCSPTRGNDLKLRVRWAGKDRVRNGAFDM